MKPAILLYSPPSTYARKSQTFPLTLLSICSLIDEKEFDISINQELPNDALKEFEPNLHNAICLGISCMTGVQIHNGLALAKKIREARPSLPIVWGGYHPTAMPEQTLQNKFVDIVVRGYGEETFPELVKRLANKQNYDDVQGISFNKDNEVVNVADRAVPDLNEFPLLPYHLFDVKKLFKETNKRTLHYISSRGCPHNCGFCADCVVYKRRWNALSSDRVVSDLERLKKNYNYDAIRFYDSNLFVSEKRIAEICKGVIEKQLNFEWLRCNGDAFILSKYSSETLRLMKKAGVSNILIGIESGYEPALRCIDKVATISDNMKAIRQLHRHGISIVFSFMFGFPYDLPKEKMEEEHQKELTATMKVISDLGCDYLSGDDYLLFIFTPYPGVRLFPRYKELGYIPPNSFEEWSTVNLDEAESCPWVEPRLLKLYAQCPKIIWFFTHKLERNIFTGTNNTLLKKWVKSWDVLIYKSLKKRIDRGQFNLPILLRIIQLYCRVKKLGLKRFIKKVFLKLMHKK